MKGLLKEKGGKAGLLMQWQTWVVIGLVAALIYVVVAQPFRDKGSAYVDISLIGPNGETLEITSGEEYILSVVDPLKLTTTGGKEFTQFHVEMGVKPVGTNISGGVAITAQFNRSFGVYQGAVFSTWKSGEGAIKKTVPINTSSVVCTQNEGIGNIFDFYNKGTGKYVYVIDFWGTGSATDKTGKTLSADFSAMGSLVFNYTAETGTLKITSYVTVGTLELV